MKVDEYRYLVIGGVSKAGTTSLYKYLADHPAVCPSSLKETRFFLDQNYPLKSPIRFNGSNLEDYDNYFKSMQCHDSTVIRVEATPDYLYSKTALRMADLLPELKFVFILRDPVERMTSWYKYSRLRGLLKGTVPFDEYIQMQIDSEVSDITPIHLRALEQGKYSLYLGRFARSMKGRILVLSFEDLRINPLGVMEMICEFSGLEKSFYSDYNFTIENASFKVNSQLLNRMYFRVQRDLSFRFHSIPWVLSLLRGPNRIVKNLIGFNEREEPHRVFISPETRTFLDEFYKPFTADLKWGKL